MDFLFTEQEPYRLCLSPTSSLLLNLDFFGEGGATDVVFLDLTKAFDSVPHEPLLIKLYSLGIEGKLFNWLSHFLTCRKQRVVVRGTFSDWAPVISGTP